MIAAEIQQRLMLLADWIEEAQSAQNHLLRQAEAQQYSEELKVWLSSCFSNKLIELRRRETAMIESLVMVEQQRELDLKEAGLL